MTRSTLASLALSIACLTGCAAEARPPAAAAPVAVAMPAPAPPLARSHFGKDPDGSIGEDDLQRVLGAPIDLQFPARIGVVPVASPFDAKGDVSIERRVTASRDLATALAGHRDFSHVSDVSTDLPNVGGLEGLRAIAARYRLRYLLLYSEHFEDRTHLNGWAWLYPTFIGMFVAPGVTVASNGLAQADLLDVRTGTVLFSVVEPIRVSSQQLMVGAARTHEDLKAAAASAAAKKLSLRVIGQTEALLAYADDAAKHGNRAEFRILPPPVLAADDASKSAAQAGR